MYRIVFYCPDKHIQYDGNTPEEDGVGGGITGRVRMASALARRGHEVLMVANCPERTTIAGVKYIPLQEVHSISADVLIVNTSGGGLDLTPLSRMKIESRLILLWIAGYQLPHNLDCVPFDFVYAPSNFLQRVVTREWDVPRQKVFVSYYGFEESLFKDAEAQSAARDPFRLVYFSHPSKGLDSAMAILQRLRQQDDRYHLEVYGGDELWGQAQTCNYDEPGVRFSGLIGQRALARALMACTYSFALQSRREPFGMVVTESMRAGCITLASPVGAYPELIQTGQDGYLIPGEHQLPETRNRAAQLIISLNADDKWRSAVQANAREVMWNSDIMVKVWEQHWHWWFARADGYYKDRLTQDCPVCAGMQLLMADGKHCLSCGIYTRTQPTSLVDQIFTRQKAYQLRIQTGFLAPASPGKSAQLIARYEF